LVALTVYAAYQQVTEDLVLKRDEELTRLSANEISSSFEDNIDRLTNLARLPDVAGGEPDVQRKALESFRNQLILFDAGTYLLDNLGSVVAYASGRSLAEWAGLVRPLIFRTYDPQSRPVLFQY
jgi:hypothetical protein